MSRRICGVNESTGIVETKHGDSDEWQPRLVPEESEHSQSGKSVHVWEVQIKGYDPDKKTDE